VGKSVPCLLLITFLLIVCLTFPNINSVLAESLYTIYIRADGSIDPPTVNITTFDNVTYMFTDNNIGGVIVERDNIILDGADHVLEGYYNLDDPFDPDTIITGIVLSGSDNVTVQNLNIINEHYGIVVGSDNCIIKENTLSTTGPWLGDKGLILLGNNNTVTDNIFPDNWMGLDLTGSGNNVLRNQFYGGTLTGLRVGYGSGSNNIIVENSILSVHTEIWENSNGTFYHNNFFEPISVYSSFQTNWNETYPIGGNYWSGYSGTDVYSGPYQNETGSDGIGDTPYVLAGDQIDNYPLMGPWTMRGENIILRHPTGARITFQEVTAGGITMFNAETGPDPPQGYKELGSCFAISTAASFSGNIQITLPFDTANLTLQEEENLKMMQWNETALAWTNITTNVDTIFYTVTGQTTYLSIFAVMWRLGGDVNGDFTVDIFDAILLAGSFNSTPESGSWNPNADLNNDNVIDIYDAIILAANFGRD
jgi:parallel beta-helix repeat protein